MVDILLARKVAEDAEKKEEEEGQQPDDPFGHGFAFNNMPNAAADGDELAKGSQHNPQGSICARFPGYPWPPKEGWHGRPPGRKQEMGQLPACTSRW
eukprot:14729321-Heterocapsa_arctica.AAC.1